MRMNNDEMYEKVADLDESIAERNALIAEAEGLLTNEDSKEVLAKVRDLNRRWRRIPYWESAFEDELAQKFEDCLNACYAKRDELFAANEQAKKELIELAKQKNANMNQLMDKWKAVGSAGKVKDEELWQEFNALRQEFFAKRKAFWESQKENFAKAKEIKEGLLVEAEALLSHENIAEADKAFQEVFEKWRQAGRADSEVNDELWDKFRAIRSQFNEKRNAFFKERREKQNAAYQAKKALVEEAKQHLADGQFTKEVTDRMKAMYPKWRQAGKAGKDRDDRIYKEFRDVMNEYFDHLNEERQARQARWQERLADNKEYKIEQLQNQKRIIERLERDKSEALAESQVREIEENIARKKEYIAQLEQEISDIENQIK